MKSVVLKLFIVTTTLIVVVFGLALLAQGMFFERYYRSSKMDTLMQDAYHFAEQYESRGSDKLELSRLIGTFMNESDASASVLNRDFQRINVNPYFVQMEAEGRTILAPIPREGTKLQDIPKGLKLGDRLVVDGIFMDEKDTVLYPLDWKTTGIGPAEGLVRVEGVLTEVMLPEQRSYNPFYLDNLVDEALADWREAATAAGQRFLNGSPEQFAWSDEWSGIEYTVLVMPLAGGSDNERYLVAMTSLQPVGEAVQMLKRYFVYLAPVLAVMVMILSFVYSKLVSRPLVRLSRSAKRLAELDFTVEPEITSKDEFGELSGHLVTMSRKLDATLSELTDANNRLRQDMLEKQRAEQLRKELVANISHELKTPLGIVKGFAEGLQDGVADDKKERYLAHIVDETDRMNELIMDMLELSKYEVKAVRLALSRFSLSQMILSTIESFSQQLEAKRLTVESLGLFDKDTIVEADPGKIEQVILNLLSNAIRHATPGSALTIIITEEKNNRVRTMIENVGDPIAEEDLGRIWEHFFRAERSRDRKSGGTGLGLAIVKHILELHGSDYGAANTEHGVAFHFTLHESRDNQ